MFVWIGTIAKSFTSGDKGSGLLQADWGAPLVLSVRLTPDAVFLPFSAATPRAWLVN
jgi:hypothetical protein